jgi:hypothetical protein
MDALLGFDSKHELVLVDDPVRAIHIEFREMQEVTEKAIYDRHFNRDRAIKASRVIVQ